MNTKTSRSMTKTRTPRVAGKAAPTTRAAPAVVSTAKKFATVQVSATTRKSASSKPARSRGSPAIAPTVSSSGRNSKQARLIEMLRGLHGVTVDQMMTLTGWQAHTVRGTISGVLRKKLGLNVACEAPTDSGPRRYRIVSSVPA